MSLVPLHLVVHLRGQAGGAPNCPPPSFCLKGCLETHESYIPNPHIKNIWSHSGHISCNYFYYCLHPSYYFDFYSCFLYCPVVEGCCMWFFVASELPLTTVQSVISTLWCHLSPMTELISFRLPLQVWPLTQSQPFGLLSWVEGTLSLGHHTGSTSNCPAACEAHETDDLSGASALCSHSIS